jgi:hypothetical protein
MDAIAYVVEDDEAVGLDGELYASPTVMPAGLDQGKFNFSPAM